MKQAQLLGYVFTDFSGRRFKFSGEDDESYNLFTEADHQLNAIVSNGSPHARQLGITLRGVGIHGPDTHVKIGSSAEGLLSCEPLFSFSCLLRESAVKNDFHKVQDLDQVHLELMDSASSVLSCPVSLSSIQ